MTGASRNELQHERHQPFAVRDAISTTTMVTSIVVCFGIVLGCSAIAWNGEVPGWEADALRWVNDWPGWPEPVMWTLQQAGVLAAPLLGGVVIAWVAHRWEYVIPFVLLMPLKLSIETAVLKQLVERQRPFVSVGPDITVRGPAFEGLSFPSGHATTSVAFAILVAAFRGGWRSRSCERPTGSDGSRARPSRRDLRHWCPASPCARVGTRAKGASNDRHQHVDHRVRVERSADHGGASQRPHEGLRRGATPGSSPSTTSTSGSGPVS